MNNVVNIRRSVREFSNRKIERCVIEEICKSGLQAPSARNSRPWEIIVIDEESVIKTISKIREPWKCLENAAVGLVVCAKMDDYYQQNCAALTENILISATDKGIGSVWLGLYPHMEESKKIGEMIECPEDIIPFCVIALGYPKYLDVFHEKEIELSKIHWQKW